MGLSNGILQKQLFRNKRMSFVKYTETATFLFPLVEVPKQIFRCDVRSSFGKLIMTTRFLNAYMWDMDLEMEFNYGPYVFVVMKPYRDANFAEFHSTVISMENYVDEYEKENYTVLIFKVPEKNLKHYDMILEGKYSKLDSEAKTLILRNNFFSSQPGILPEIFTKSARLRESWEKALSCPHPEPRISSMVSLGDQEVWKIINREKEGFSDEILRNLGKTPKLSPEKEFNN
jgi:hypothetical protein